MAAADHEQALLADLQFHGNLRRAEVNAGSASAGQQLAAHFAFHIKGAEGMTATALAADSKGLAGQARGIDRQHLIRDRIQVTQRVLKHFQHVGNPRHITHGRNQFRPHDLVRVP